MWIKCTPDTMPDNADDMLVYNGCIYVAYYEKESKLWKTINDEGFNMQVLGIRYYMPLPSPPEE